MQQTIQHIIFKSISEISLYNFNFWSTSLWPGIGHRKSQNKFYNFGQIWAHVIVFIFVFHYFSQTPFQRSNTICVLVEGPNRWTYFWKRTIQWLFHQHFVLFEQMVSDKKIVMGISHRVLLYVKLSSAVAAILVRGLKCWTQFWKGTTQGSFHQSLVAIGPVVSEEKIFMWISHRVLHVHVC